MWFGSNFYASFWWESDWFNPGGSAGDIPVPRKMTGMAGVGMTQQRRNWGSWRKPRK